MVCVCPLFIQQYQNRCRWYVSVLLLFIQQYQNRCTWYVVISLLFVQQDQNRSVGSLCMGQHHQQLNTSTSHLTVVGNIYHILEENKKRTESGSNKLNNKPRGLPA